MKRTSLLNNRHGFTLIEVIVVMAVFLTVLVIASQTFKTIITFASKYSKSEESNIEGVIGLEIMRHDIEQMGFGLFWGYLPGASATYSESIGADAATNTATNDASNAPRAFVAINGTSSTYAAFSSDLIGIKATTVGRSKPSQRWTYINYSGASGKPPVSWPSNNLKSSDKVIAIRHNFNDVNDDHLLLVDTGNSNAFEFTTGSIIDAYRPVKDQQVSMVYGVEATGTTLRMPFNRADFFISTTAGTVPPFCAPLTGVLYKMTVNQADGDYLPIPLLDCVADMQMVLGWDISEGGNANSVSAYSNADGTAVSAGTMSDIQGWLASPQGIREHLKLVKVYILAQEGRRDPGYTYPSASIVVGDVNNGETTLTSRNNLPYTFTAAQLQYHWRLYRLIVRPKNLVSNQR